MVIVGFGGKGEGGADGRRNGEVGQDRFELLLRPDDDCWHRDKKRAAHKLVQERRGGRGRWDGTKTKGIRLDEWLSR